MAVTINASTTAGLVQTADTSGVLALQTAGTTAVTVDASQNVGLGVTPSAWDSTYKAIQVGARSMFFGIGSEANMANNAFYNAGYKYVATSAAGLYTIDANVHKWYNAASGTAGNAITFTQAMTLNANGVLALQGASTSANGVGITFPATQSASSNANTLDDYEEGTWTPSVGGSATYGAQQNGWYVKVGQLVTVACDMTIATIGTGNTQLISGLPFSANTGGVTNGGGAVSYWANLSSGIYSIATQLSGTTIAFVTTTGSQSTVTNVAAILTSGTRIITTISYLTSS